MRQVTLASQASFEKYGRKSRRELFLDEIERTVPWSAMESLVRPHYAKAGNGRQPVGLSIMLRTHFVQQWFNLSDPGAEELLYESAAVRRFVGVDLGAAPAPDETTILRFRHLLEKHKLGELMLDAVNVHLETKGIKIQTGAIVDATIIHAPSSTKNEKKERDPEMHQTKKGNRWYFGLNAHRRRREGRPCALGGDHRGQRVGRAPAARPAAWRGAQGMGRRGPSRPDRSHQRGSAERAGHDLQANEVQGWRGRVAKEEEPE
jgi:IS5 family transposase